MENFKNDMENDMKNDLKYLNNIKSVINRDELRRLEKAAKDKNKIKLLDWAKQFEYQIAKEYQKKFENDLRDGMSETIDNFVLTIVYTLHFNESTHFGAKRIDSFMNDLLETIDMFRRGEAVPDDYRKQLKEEGIIVKRSEK